MSDRHHFTFRLSIGGKVVLLDLLHPWRGIFLIVVREGLETVLREYFEWKEQQTK